jgi:hypothetical protein
MVAKADEERFKVVRDMVIAEHIDTARNPGGCIV